jgi:hypothetical protein
MARSGQHTNKWFLNLAMSLQPALTVGAFTWAMTFLH